MRATGFSVTTVNYVLPSRKKVDYYIIIIIYYYYYYSIEKLRKSLIFLTAFCLLLKLKVKRFQIH